MQKRKAFFNLIVVILGNILYAAGVVFFIIPSGLITGGTTGIAISLNHYFGLPVAYCVLAFNLLMFILGFFILGRKFALTTLLSTLCYPLALGLLQRYASGYLLTDDIFLSTLFGGICIGVSIALVIRAGASTGGVDIPPLILNKHLRIPVSVSLYIADCIILLFQAFFNDRDKILYGIVLVIIYSVVLDKLLTFGTNKIQIKVISRKINQIKEAIITDVDRGTTLIHGKTGYLEEDTYILLSVISNRELVKVERIVHEIDKEAFVIISRVNEVKGKGFSISKEHLR